MKSLFAQPVSTLDVLPPGQTAAIITITASTLQAGISERLSALIQSISTVVSAFIIAMYYSWSLALITSSGLLLIVITYAITTPFLVKQLSEVQQADIQASTTANEIFNSKRMVDACGAHEKMIWRYATWVDESRRRGLKMSPIIALQQAPGKSHLILNRAQCLYLTLTECHHSSVRRLQVRTCAVSLPRVYALMRISTFALSFWYALKMHMELQFNSAETLIV